MKTIYIFPVILMVLDICASIVYLSYKDYIMSIYWVSAFILTLCVTIK